MPSGLAAAGLAGPGEAMAPNALAGGRRDRLSFGPLGTTDQLRALSVLPGWQGTSYEPRRCGAKASDAQVPNATALSEYGGRVFRPGNSARN